MINSSPHYNGANNQYRPDIDGLRAIAVLSVMGFHAFPEIFSGGFIGVDMFFVVSGYLISKTIIEGLVDGSFRFSNFYARRIRRIFPALLTLVISSFVFGWFALLTDEFQSLCKHIAAGTVFSSNFLLLSESGYFDALAETKPFLHLWSLGIEEQFYILWPLLLWLAWKRRVNWLIVAVCLGSFSFFLSIREVRINATAAFYSPQTRFWELLTGSLLAGVEHSETGSIQQLIINITTRLTKVMRYGSQKIGRGIVSDLLAFIGVLLLALGYWQSKAGPWFPRIWPLYPVLATFLITAAGQESWLNRSILSNKIAVWFGLISYPLYLWHWPLLSFARIVESEVPSPSYRIAILILSVVLAWLTFILIERPLRRGLNAVPIAWALAALMGTAGLLGMIWSRMDGDWRRPSDAPGERAIAQRVQAERTMITEAVENCRRIFPDWTETNDNTCLVQSRGNISIALIGDSHAGQLFVGLGELAPMSEGIAAFPVSCAAPFLDVATGLKDTAARKFRVGGDKLISRAYEFIIENRKIRDVILAHDPECSFKDAIDLKKLDTNDYREALTAGMIRTFAALSRANKNVLVLLANPHPGYDPKLCVKRPFRLTKKADRCEFPKTILEKNRAYSTYRSLLEKVLRDFPTVKSYDLSKVLCES